jgi:tetraacyldisaccharide 4'-kinase
MKVLKPKFWSEKNSLLSFILLPISIFLQVLRVFQKKAVIKRKSSIPVICVGNIYLGGTGKTPLSLEIIKILKKIHKKTAIIKKSYREHRDEFNLIESKNIKLFKNSNRFKAICEAINQKFDCVVLDDGFQDYSINKDLNILCFNAGQLIGNGMTLPSGPLREPFSSLKRCQVVVINGNAAADFEKKIKDISKNISIYYSKYLPTNIENFKEQNLLAFAGIGNPENFFKLLEDNKLKLKKKILFPDHYNYSLEELNNLIDFSLKNNLKLITTEKDFFRIKHFKLPHIKYLEVKLEISNKESFEKKIIKYL